MNKAQKIVNTLAALAFPVALITTKCDTKPKQVNYVDLKESKLYNHREIQKIRNQAEPNQREMLDKYISEIDADVQEVLVTELSTTDMRNMLGSGIYAADQVCERIAQGQSKDSIYKEFEQKTIQNTKAMTKAKRNALREIARAGIITGFEVCQ